MAPDPIRARLKAVRRKVSSRAVREMRGPDPVELFARLVARGVVEVGAGTYGALKVEVYGEQFTTNPAVSIGRYCSIGPESFVIVNGDHRTDWTTTFPIRAAFDLGDGSYEGHPRLSGPLVVGSDVWIGARALLFGGTTIGDGAVIASGAVVTKDVPPYAIVGGNPATVIRRRFSDDVTERLQQLQWWRLEPADVEELSDLLCAEPDLDRLQIELDRRLPGSRPQTP